MSEKSQNKVVTLTLGHPVDKINPTDTDVTTVTKLCQNGAMNLATSRLVH